MAKGILPKPGTVLSVEWQEIGPLLKVEGDAIGLIVSLGIIAGMLNKNCNIPIDVMTYAVSHGRELIDAALACEVSDLYERDEIKRASEEVLARIHAKARADAEALMEEGEECREST